MEVVSIPDSRRATPNPRLSGFGAARPLQGVGRAARGFGGGRDPPVGAPGRAVTGRATDPSDRSEAVMSARIGFDRYTIEHRGLTPHETLEFARSHGLDGVQFLEPAAIDPALDPARLAAFSQRADA